MKTKKNMNDVVDEVSKGMNLIFEGLRFVQSHEDVLANRKAARSMELLRRRKVRSYSELEADTSSAARISAGDTPVVIDYGVFEPYFSNLGLPSLTSTDPQVLRVRNYVGQELFAIVAEASKIIADQRALRFEKRDYSDTQIQPNQ